MPNASINVCTIYVLNADVQHLKEHSIILKYHYKLILLSLST